MNTPDADRPFFVAYLALVREGATASIPVEQEPDFMFGYFQRWHLNKRPTDVRSFIMNELETRAKVAALVAIAERHRHELDDEGRRKLDQLHAALDGHEN